MFRLDPMRTLTDLYLACPVVVPCVSLNVSMFTAGEEWSGYEALGCVQGLLDWVVGIFFTAEGLTLGWGGRDEMGLYECGDWEFAIGA